MRIGGNPTGDRIFIGVGDLAIYILVFRRHHFDVVPIATEKHAIVTGEIGAQGSAASCSGQRAK